MRKRFWVVDNFYPNPDDIRNIALNTTYFDGGHGRGFFGKRSTEQFLFPGLKEVFEDIMGTKIVEWEQELVNGRFQLCIAGEPLVYHSDTQKWAGVLFLTPDAPYSCGTTFFASHNRIRDSEDPNIGTVYHQNTRWLDRTQYVPVDVVGNVYNRLVIFDAHLIHSASEYFGDNMQNGRLFQVFFFS